MPSLTPNVFVLLVLLEQSGNYFSVFKMSMKTPLSYPVTVFFPFLPKYKILPFSCSLNSRICLLVYKSPTPEHFRE